MTAYFFLDFSVGCFDSLKKGPVAAVHAWPLEIVLSNVKAISATSPGLKLVH